MGIPVRPLGQAGFRFDFDGCVVYLDPYLSDSVEELEGPAFARQRPAPCAPREVADADWVLVSHAHLDHCDPGTLPELAKASPGCRFLGPGPVRRALARFGLDAGRVVAPGEGWLALADGLRVHAVPAAHPQIERDEDGGPRCLGFVLEHRGRRLYHAGDTSLCEGLLAALRPLRPIEVAILPVNEANFFRARMGIVGNLSLREAFGLAGELGVETLVPIHWDLFAPNAVHEEEIELLHRLERPGFALALSPAEL